MFPEPYHTLKTCVHRLARISTETDDAGAKARGYSDVFDFLIADHDGKCQPRFLAMLLSEVCDECDRHTLLDGLASEYASARGWMAYLHSEHWRR